MSPQIPFPLREQKVDENQPFKPNLNVALVCPDCRIKPPQIVEEFASGDLVCGDCGLVLGDRIIDTRSEWRTFANDEGDDPSRVGAASNPLLDGDQLDTIISRKDGGTGISKSLNKVQGKQLQHKGDRNMASIYKEITAMCDSISLSKLVSDTAKQLYKRVEDEKLLRGKSNDAIIAACICIACRQERVARTFREICALTRVPKKEIGRCCNALKAKLQTSTSVMNSEDLMSRFCSNLQLPNYVQKSGVDLVRRAKELGTLAGKSPISVAAACIYLVSYLFKNPRSTKDIANVAGVSEATIKAAYKSLYTEKEKLIDFNSMKDNPNCENISFDDLVLP
ncbi:hypothetical protein INT46_006937 [Mucor plumbeus]|uniref:Transcription initiation factor IIB n=1 Tax=Mucor plumbeus TaxID=97098 RepID=A0A8H7R5P8_9FUNG|nr:hypothetical protein INT46_006937 [Mucor plumbeus]